MQWTLEGKHPIWSRGCKRSCGVVTTQAVPSHQHTETSYSENFLCTAYHSSELSFPPENYPSLPWGAELHQWPPSL